MPTTFHVALWIELLAAGLGGLQGALFAAGERHRRIDLFGVIVIGLAVSLGGSLLRVGIIGAIGGGMLRDVVLSLPISFLQIGTLYAVAAGAGAGALILLTGTRNTDPDRRSRLRGRDHVPAAGRHSLRLDIPRAAHGTASASEGTLSPQRFPLSEDRRAGAAAVRGPRRRACSSRAFVNPQRVALPRSPTGCWSSSRKVARTLARLGRT
jgi:hypothetical protein